MTRDSMRAYLRRHGADASLAVLALVYLSFGVRAHAAVGLAGTAGAVLVIVALLVHRRAHRIAAALLVVGALPFAAAAWWTVVIPLTGLLMVAIGVPHLVGRSEA